MDKLTFVELGKKILAEQNRPLAPSEIWKIAVSQGDNQRLETTGKTPAQTLYSAIFLNQRDDPNTDFVKYNTSPVRYFLKSLTKDQQPLELQEKAALEPQVPQIHHFLEKDLHCFLSYFAYSRFEASTKTIKHQGSTKKEFGEWVHPDMIAVKYPTWHADVGNLSARFGDTGLKFFSFELKKELTFHNLRESFFQAVSNSSWAHEGYLVASDVSPDGEFREELRRLSSSFGIGVIEIDVEDPDSSEIIFSAKERDVVDWDTLNKLVKLNPDAQALVDHINKAMRIRDYKYGVFDSTDRPKPLVSPPTSAS